MKLLSLFILCTAHFVYMRLFLELIMRCTKSVFKNIGLKVLDSKSTGLIRQSSHVTKSPSRFLAKKAREIWPGFLRSSRLYTLYEISIPAPISITKYMVLGTFGKLDCSAK